MKPRDFYKKVEEHPHLDWLGCREGPTPDEDAVLISFDGHDSWQPAKFALAVSAIGDHSWEELLAVLTCQRPARIMTHVTRIVGYYSQLQNWNPSKIAELRDRQKGDYLVPEAMVKGDGNVEEVTGARETEAATAGEPAAV